MARTERARVCRRNCSRTQTPSTAKRCRSSGTRPAARQSRDRRTRSRSRPPGCVTVSETRISPTPPCRRCVPPDARQYPGDLAARPARPRQCEARTARDPAVRSPSRHGQGSTNRPPGPIERGAWKPSPAVADLSPRKAWSCPDDGVMPVRVTRPRRGRPNSGRACSVDPTMSVTRMVASTRSAPAGARRPVRNRSTSSRTRVLIAHPRQVVVARQLDELWRPGSGFAIQRPPRCS